MSRHSVLDVGEHDLEDLRRRLRDTRWAEPWPVQDWEAGADQAELRRLVDVWVNGFDWRAQQQQIDELPWHRADIDGTPVAYLRFDAEPGGTGIPVVLWHLLMTEHLTFPRYLAHGGDLGAGTTSRLAQAYPEEVVGIHLLSTAAPAHLDEESITAEEQAHLDRVQEWSASEGGYQHQQQTRPLTLAPAVSDSPVGLLSWILEKHRSWSDCGGDVSSRFSDDYLLTLASVYWFTNSIGTSFRPYYEYAAGLTSRIGRVEVPTAVALFPHDLASPPRSWIERTYNLVRYTRMPRGGHFAPHEEPALLADDISTFARALPHASPA